MRRERRVVISTPPQHGKTETTLHGIVWLMSRRAGKRSAYVSYEANRAEDMSLRCQMLASEAGLRPRGSRRVWQTGDGSTLLAAGIGGPLTGYGVDGLMIVDDPVKNRVEAESSTFRDRTDEWFRDVAMTRVHPGASVVIIQTRWHNDDLAGRQIQRGWEHINLRAIGDDGAALWEAQRPLAWLNERRVEIGEYSWASLYQGDPRPRGGRVFNDVVTYQALPRTGFRICIGVDFAYSSKTYADYSVAVVLGETEGRYYVLEVVRKQCAAPDFARELLKLKQRYQSAKFIAHVSGIERGIVDLIKTQSGLSIRTETARADKFTRAQDVAAAWNAGKVLVPLNAPWVNEFVEELSSFTGVKDRHDDQVDALASSFTDFAGPTRGRIEIPY